LVWGLHSGPLREALHRFKYKRDLGLADAFAELLIEVFQRAGEETDLVVPVPLGRKRQRERGFNQAAMLAAAFSGKLGIVYRPGAAKRIRETRSQVGLSVPQRRENVAGAFQADPKTISGKRVLLIDDVLTTGATLNACARALKDAGAAAVVALTLARAP
jgi:ComF family protein